jgi:Zn-dependent peptidase ImmA (M78 family)/DNA-binding XRE family transcriptional regulator
MRPGTPGFTADRLREAREVRGLSAIALAEMVGVSRQALSLYETGKTTPGPETLERIAQTLNLPLNFFVQPPRDRESGTIYYRSMSSATKTARTRAERRFEWLHDLVRYVSEFVELPVANFPDLRVSDDPLLLSDAEIVEAARDVREFWGLRTSPIANMVSLLENQGAILARDELGADTLEGMSEFVVDQGRPFILIGTDKGSPVRWRFDAAHELGHLVLHSNLDRSLLTKAEHFKQIEKQAHRFAGAFLLPIESFGEDLFGASLDGFQALKLKWKVSIATMIKQARLGNLISEETERRLWIGMSRRGWRKLEPYDEVMDVEEPRLLRRSFELLLEEGAQTPEDVLSALALPASDVETLTGLPRDFMSSFSRVNLRSSSPPTDSFLRQDARPADVIPMGFRRRQ